MFEDAIRVLFGAYGADVTGVMTIAAFVKAGVDGLKASLPPEQTDRLRWGFNYYWPAICALGLGVGASVGMTYYATNTATGRSFIEGVVGSILAIALTEGHKKARQVSERKRLENAKEDLEKLEALRNQPITPVVQPEVPKEPITLS